MLRRRELSIGFDGRAPRVASAVTRASTVTRTAALPLESEPFDARKELLGSRARTPRFRIPVGYAHPVAAASLGEIQRLVGQFNQPVKLRVGAGDQRGAAD